MPFYEYQCSSCHTHVEVLQKISDTPLRKCPNCGKQQLKRLISAPVFRLKGGGWYETDFKSDKEGKRNLAEHPDKESKDTTAADATAKASDAKADAKTETKEAPKPAEAKPPGEARSTSAISRGGTESRSTSAISRGGTGSRSTAKISKPKAKPAPARRKAAKR